MNAFYLLLVGCAPVPQTPEASSADAGRIPPPCDVSVPEDAATVQAAVDAAPDGARICIGAGTFVGTVELTDRTDLTLVGKGPGRTILDGDGAGSTVSTFATTFTLVGMTLTGGRGAQGGGLYAEQSTGTIRRVTMSGNHATQSGGGLVGYESGLDLADVAIVGNTSDGGSGGIGIFETGLVGDRVRIASNRALGSGSTGGGIGASRGGLQLTNSAIVGNRVPADGYGGGMDLYDIGSFHDVIVAGNEGGLRGGGANLYGYYGSDFQDVVIAGNHATTGGGLAIDGMGYTPDVRNAIIVRNRADQGGGLSVSGDYVTVDLTYSDLWHNAGGDVDGMADPTGTDGNVSVDPRFVAFDPRDKLRTWDFHLAADSPLIDAGDPALLDADGTRSDMGAYGGPDGG
jgi:hypothetical protein